MSNIRFVGYTGLFLSGITNDTLLELIFERGLTPTIEGLSAFSNGQHGKDILLEFSINGPTSRSQKRYYCYWDRQKDEYRFTESVRGTGRARKNKRMSEDGWRIEILSTLTLDDYQYRDPAPIEKFTEKYIENNLESLLGGDNDGSD